MRGILLFYLIYILTNSRRIDAVPDSCNVNGRIYRAGEQWTTMPDNRLLRCQCLGNGRGQWNCQFTNEDAFIIVSDSNKIGKITLGGNIGFKQKFIEQLQGHTVANDVDVERDYVFWTDVSFKNRGIYRAKYADGAQVVRIVSEDIYEPNGISVDWLAKNIYWTDAQLGAIFVAGEDGKHRTMVLGGLSEPRSILVLPLHGIMFWSDQQDGAIYSAKMDGSEKKAVITGLVWPNEIAVDTKTSKIYWVDAYRHSIESCNFNGYFYKMVLNYTLTFGETAFGLSLFNDRLYFSIWREKSVFSITTLGQDLKRVVSGLTDLPSGLTIINSKMQQIPTLNAIGPCRASRKACSHICLPISRAEYKCSCPDNKGIVLGKDMHTCIAPSEFLLFSSLGDGTIMMVSQQFGAPREPVLLTRSDQPSAIAYDPLEERIYWSDVARNAIFRMFLNATKKELFLENGIGIVDGIAIDWVNRHLYFTNYGWSAANTEFHRIEMINLKGGARKILTYADLDKPRDLVIDQERGLLYYSDWGAKAKVVRLDLDGRNPYPIPIHVENPNGLALYENHLYITDSHHKSALMQINGTVVFGNPPSLIKYNTVLQTSEDITDLNMEVPFGASIKKGTLFVSDWGTESITELDLNTGDTKLVAHGIKKPTGVAYGTMTQNKKVITQCMVANPCSHTCVNVDKNHFSCVCPDIIGYALSENKLNCVAPDQFILVADVNKIIMKSQSPMDAVPYAVVQTFDDYSNIVAVTFDPQTQYIYWADNGRQRISRKAFGYAGSTYDQIEVIYNDIERVEGMALDSENKLLYWTDAELGTIEMLHLPTRAHSTVLENLLRPRAIALDPKMGVMYWTENGMRPTVQTGLMNGQDMRTFVNTALKWPNGLLFDTEDDTVYVADGGLKKIQSLSAIGGDTLSYMNLNNTVDHIYGIGKIGRAVVYTDWFKGALMSTDTYETKILVRNMSRPSQIYVHSTFIPDSFSQCTTSVHECSHICVPSPGSYVCLCPDHLVLTANLRMCVRPEELYRYTTTLAPPTTQAIPETTVFDQEEETTVAEDIFVEEDEDLILKAIVQSTTAPNITELEMTTLPGTPQKTTGQITTVPFTTTPSPPKFTKCPEDIIKIQLPSDDAVAEISVAKLGVEAVDGWGNKLNPFIADKLQRQLMIGEHVVKVVVTDSLVRMINCDVRLIVEDVTPPKILYCPEPLEIESYSFQDSAYVTWDEPEFEDNSESDIQVFNSHAPGHYPDGLHNITYKAVDPSGNTKVCSFLVGVLHLSATCGEPWEPPRSFLTCHTNKASQQQICKMSCEEGYRMTLEDPYIRCKMDSKKASPTWMPFLDENVCLKPSIGNPQQEVQLQYPSPCDNSTSFYSYTLGLFKAKLKDEANCMMRKHKLGFCINPDQKLRLNCIREDRLNVTIKVDLADIRGIESTMEATRIVKRSSTEILDMAVSGKLKTRGSDMSDYMVDGETMALSSLNIMCMSGFKAVKEGCVACPRGTYWKENDCHFCPLHTYQPSPASMTCFECEPGTGTETVGASNALNCEKMVYQGGNGQVNMTYVIIGAVVAAVVLLLILLILAGLLHKRKKKKQIEKAIRRKKIEAKRRRRQQQRRNSDGTLRRGGSRRPSSKGRSIDSGTEMGSRTSSKRSSGSKRVTISNSNVEHKIPRRDELQDMDLKLKAWKDAMQKKGFELPGNENKRMSVATSDDRSEITESNVETSIAPSDTETSIKMRSQAGSITSDLGDETLSCGSSSRTTTPIKGVLKKPRNRNLSTEDNLSTISGSTIDMPQQRRGRGIQRNESQRLPQTNPHPGIERVRSSSLDRGLPTDPRNMNQDPRFMTLPHNRRQGISPMSNPPDYHAAVGGPPPRMMVRPRPMMFGMPNQRMPPRFMPVRPGTGPMLPQHPVRPQPRFGMSPGHYNTGYWNNGFDGNSDWETMSAMSEADGRSNPRPMRPPNMMMARFPPRGMRPRPPMQMSPFPQRPRRY